MKAIIKKFAEPGLVMEDWPMPSVGDRDVLIKVNKVSICGTDLNIYKWDPWARKNVPVPLVIGHEFVGTIVELGKAVKGLKIGERVTAEGHLVCGKCQNCLEEKRHLCVKTVGLGYHSQGCFAEYVVLPEENVFLLPASIPDEVAAIMDPLGNAMHTALSHNLTGEDVLITGAGPIGSMAAAIARKAGARYIVITDVKKERLDLALRMGATHAVDVSKTSIQKTVQELGLSSGFTVGMEMSGNAHAFSSLLESMRHGGHVALLGILPPNVGIDWDLVIFRMLTLKGIYGREIFSTWFKMIALLESGLEIAPIITHRFSFDEFEKGFEVMLSGNCGKVILSL